MSKKFKQYIADHFYDFDISIEQLYFATEITVYLIPKLIRITAGKKQLLETDLAIVDIAISDDIQIRKIADNVWIYTAWIDIPKWGLIPANGVIVLSGNEIALIEPPGIIIKLKFWWNGWKINGMLKLQKL